MVPRVSIQQAANHLLVRDLGAGGVALEEIHTPFAKRDSDLHTVIAQHQLIRRRQEVLDDFESSEWFISVLSHALHRSSSLGASNRRQKSESRHRGT